LRLGGTRLKSGGPVRDLGDSFETWGDSIEIWGDSFETWGGSIEIWGTRLRRGAQLRLGGDSVEAVAVWRGYFVLLESRQTGWEGGDTVRAIVIRESTIYMQGIHKRLVRFQK
jgi:hypothetical protein